MLPLCLLKFSIRSLPHYQAVTCCLLLPPRAAKAPSQPAGSCPWGRAVPPFQRESPLAGGEPGTRGWTSWVITVRAEKLQTEATVGRLQLTRRVRRFGNSSSITAYQVLQAVSEHIAWGEYFMVIQSRLLNQGHSSRLRLTRKAPDSLNCTVPSKKRMGYSPSVPKAIQEYCTKHDAKCSSYVGFLK